MRSTGSLLGDPGSCSRLGSRVNDPSGSGVEHRLGTNKVDSIMAQKLTLQMVKNNFFAQKMLKG